jgi:hypothetical protein
MATVDLVSKRSSRHGAKTTSRNAQMQDGTAGTPHPSWDAFLLRVTAGDVELVKFLQRFIGYCMTGHTSEHVFLFIYGTGRNGKGTFVNTIMKIFGDYAAVASIATFLSSKCDRIRPKSQSCAASASWSRRKRQPVECGTKPRSGVNRRRPDVGALHAPGRF